MPNKIDRGNPYTHEEHSRTSHAAWELSGIHTCEWCGQRNGHKGLFEYDHTGKLFCSKQCFIAYGGDWLWELR